MRQRQCPLCGASMTYEEADPDTGILVDGWQCDGCDHFEATDPADFEDDWRLAH